MNQKLSFLLFFFASISLFSQHKTDSFQIDSKYLGEARTVEIALPEHYGQSTKTYPVIFVLDQGLLFDLTTSISQQLSRTSRMPESIVVTISPGNKHRNFFAPNLYNNHRDRPYNYGNHQQEFVSFLEKELLPAIDQQYRTEPFKTLVGFSPSSVISLYTLLHKPNLFQAYICFAAGNIIGDGYEKDKRLIEELDKLYAKTSIQQQYLYVVSGSKDAQGQPYINTNVSDFNSKLSKYQSQNIFAKAELIAGEGHTDVILPGLISAFDFLYPKEKWLVDYLDLIEEEGSAKANILTFYKKLSDEYGFKIYPNADRLYSMSCLKNIGRRLMGRKKMAEAVELYQYWTDLYPKAHSAHYFLGLAYKNTDKTKAIQSFTKAYQLAVEQKSKEADNYKKELESLE